MPTIAYLRPLPSCLVLTSSMRARSVRITGSWKQMPKAMISVMMKPRYSLTRVCISICTSPGVGLLHAEEEVQRHRRHDEIDQQRAEHEEHRRRDEIGHEGAALALVEARRDEGVDLRRR